VYSPKLYRTEAKVSGQRNRVQPELRRLIVAIHVNMGRLVGLMTVKIHAAPPVRLAPFSISPPCGGFPLHCCQSAAGRGAGRGKEASNTLLYTGRQERVYCRTSGSGPLNVRFGTTGQAKTRDGNCARSRMGPGYRQPRGVV
jgi:hypothetical protein